MSSSNSTEKQRLFSDPRLHHYTFAHLLLNRSCEANPIGFFKIMASDQRDSFVERLWQKVCDLCAQQGEPDFGSGDIKFSALGLHGNPTILVEMPEAKAVAEAIMIAIVLLLNKATTDSTARITHRYFVLELGVDTQGHRRTSLCEWKDGNHANYGDGPVPEAGAFLAAVDSRILSA